MNIFFDFELTGDNIIDMHLLDILLALKEEVSKLLSPIKEELENADIFFIIQLKDKVSQTMCVSADDVLEKKARELLLPLNFREVINRFANVGLS